MVSLDSITEEYGPSYTSEMMLGKTRLLVLSDTRQWTLNVNLTLRRIEVILSRDSFQSCGPSTGGNASPANAWLNLMFCEESILSKAQL